MNIIQWEAVSEITIHIHNMGVYVRGANTRDTVAAVKFKWQLSYEQLCVSFIRGAFLRSYKPTEHL